MAKRPVKGSGFKDALIPFRHDEATAHLHAKVQRQVLRVYGHCCAFTGQPFLPLGIPDPNQNIVLIRPPERGGAFHITNLIPLVADAAEAFVRGHLTVGARYELIPDLSLVDPELLERLNALGRMILPKTVKWRPDAAELEFHRINVFRAFATE